MYHVELRQAGHQVRAFNLTDEQLRSRFITPLRGDRLFICEDVEFDPRKTRVRVLEGPELRIDQLALGRGWTEAERICTDVSERFTSGPSAPLERDARAALKDRIVGRVAAGPVPLAQIPPMATDLLPGRRASEQIAVAEIAVWELLHQAQMTLHRDGEAIPPSEWEPVVLSAASWLSGDEITLGQA